MSIGERIKELREKMNWSQIDLSKKTGIHNSVLSRIEASKRSVEDEEINIFANVFDVSTDYLLGRTMEPNLTVEVAGQEIKLSAEEYKVFEEIKKHPIMFHDLATNPERKVRQLIKMWEFIKKDLEEDDDRDDIIED